MVLRRNERSLTETVASLTTTRCAGEQLLRNGWDR
jgi:hypothetical protein